MTEGEFKKRASGGAPLRFGLKIPEAERTIEASWLTRADISLDLRHAIIVADLRWHDRRVECRWIFRHCVFQGAIDLSGSIFESVVQFNGCTCENDVTFDRCRFLNGLLCNPLEESEGRTVTHFKKGFRMVAARVNGDMEFVGAVFGGETKFARMRTDDELRFSHGGQHAIFEQKVSFLQVRVGGELMLDHCIFRKDAEFYNIDVSGPAFFRYTQFAGKGVKLRFRHGRFHAEVNFKDAYFDSSPDMTYASFGEELRFERTKWNGNASDLSYARVNGDLILSGSTQSHYVLRGASVKGLTFDKAWLESATPVRQGAKISLSDTSYERIDPEDTEPKMLVRSLINSIKKEADISTRRKFITVLNRQGLEDIARDAERILRQGARSRLSVFEQVVDFIYGTLFDYGISPWIVVVLPLSLIILGLFAYSRPNAVVWKMDQEELEAIELSCKLNEGSEKIDCSAKNSARKTTIGLVKAAAVSLHYALPGEIPLGKNYEPSDERLIACFPILTSEGYATVQRVVGWMTIPLIVAACAGLIWRRTGEKEAEAELE